MTTPTAGELALLRTQPQRSKLYLSIFEPQIVFQARVNDVGAAKGDMVITYDTVTGNYLDILGGMTVWVGSTAGARDKGSIYTYSKSSSTLTVGENSHINWKNNDYITIVNYHQLWPLYPRYVQSATDITVYKLYSQEYTDQNEDLGSFIVMGGNYAGFVNQTTGSCLVYYDGSESENVIGTTGTAYSWIFDGGNPTGTTAITPGWVSYTGTGHYQARLTLTTPDGHDDFGIRHVSIYDRPGEGPTPPILNWGLESLAGSRDEGGYSGRIWVKEDVSNVIDGALVVIFSDDWYGDTQQSIGGNASNREHIFFAGYIMDGSIDYDYQTSTVFFDVGSPSEIMKICEAFGVEVEDSGDPEASALENGGDPWFYLVGLSTKTALYHYYTFHSTVQTLMDIRYVGTEFDLSHFSADRTSLYDASNTFLKTALYGKACSDRQGALYFEIEAGAIDDAANTLNTNMFIDSHDWMGNPNITEGGDDVSYYEAGGTAYYGISAGSGTYTPLLSAGPGLTPAYRGRNMKITGLALTSQGQLNTLVGNIWENMNSAYPDVSLDLVGNFRNIDIAPQEVVKLTLNVADTFRGISWDQKAFTPTSMTWNYDAQNNLLLPSVSLAEVTQGNAGQTIAIPLEPPDAGYKQPPIQLPPPMPSFPIPPIDWGIGGGGQEWIDAVGGVNDTDRTVILYTAESTPAGWVAPPSKNSYFHGYGTTRIGYVGTITIYLACYIYTSKQSVFRNLPTVWEIQAGEFISSSALIGASDTYISGAAGWYNVAPLSFVSAGETWAFRMKGWRLGTSGDDTNDGNVGIHGWWIVYS